MERQLSVKREGRKCQGVPGEGYVYYIYVCVFPREVLLTCQTVNDLFNRVLLHVCVCVCALWHINVKCF